MLKISVVLPTYNESTWLKETIQKLYVALKVPGVNASEIIVVNDGSTDNTGSVIKSLQSSYPIRYINQKNAGRFLARKKGIDTAKHEYVLLIDSRVHISSDSLKHVAKKIKIDPSRRIWNAHVIVAKKRNIYARFWDAITFVAWRKYFSNPREVSYGIEEFDYYPKGTTCFLAPKSLIKEAVNNFESNSQSMKSSNDDTLLIRRLAEHENINISPQFSCTYHSRSSLRQFLKHAYHRGQVFVDGFLRQDGNRFFWPLVSFLILTILITMVLALFWRHAVLIVGTGLMIWVMELFAALLMGVTLKDSLSLFILSPIFALWYGAGIWTATLRMWSSR